jgi:hypothetical protein
MIDKIKRIFKKKDTRDGLDFVFEHAGHTFYTFPRIEVAAAQRYLAYIRLVREHELGVSRSDLRAFIEMMKQAANKGDIARQGALLHSLEAYTELYTDNKRVFEVANCFLLVDDEPVDKFSDKHSLLKKQLFDTSEAVRFFFIKTAVSYIEKVVDSPQDFNAEDYLKSDEVKLTEKAFSRLMQSSSSGASKKT